MVLEPRIIVALDNLNQRQLLKLLDQLSPTLCRVKIGKELFTRCGPDIVKQAQSRGFDVFLDLKFYDIPNTVAQACRVGADLGVWMMTIHASGGRAMMEAASQSLREYESKRPILVAVTMLTSLSEVDLIALGIQDTPEKWVLRLADLAKKSGVDGIVSSAQEAQLLRAHLPATLCIVTPGIRLPDAKADDQQRIMTPVQAIEAGSNYLVIGRPITQAVNPSSVLQTIAIAISNTSPP